MLETYLTQLVSTKYGMFTGGKKRRRRTRRKRRRKKTKKKEEGNLEEERDEYNISKTGNIIN